MMSESLEFVTAVRRSVPLLISISSVSGGGKTYSALLLASGIAGPNGKVGFLDTENGRGTMYADSPGIVKALPDGYVYSRLDPPFSPERYVAKIQAAEKAGINVLVVDSVTHEWEGIGGCTEIAEKNKLRGMPNWSKAKMEHKRFMNQCLSTNMHLIFCIRAREKTKIVKDANGKETFVPIGVQPVTEKNFVFEMLVSLMLEEQAHFAVPIKVPEPLVQFFPGGKMVTQSDGLHIRQWNDTGRPAAQNEHLIKRSRAAAEQGMAAYTEYFKGLTPVQKKALADSVHEENKKIAAQADAEAQAASETDPAPTPAPSTGQTAVEPAIPAVSPAPSADHQGTDWFGGDGGGSEQYPD